jgi:folate-binding protein YgfZ
MTLQALRNIQRNQGAVFTPDGRIERFSCVEEEYRSVIEHVGLLDLSHRGRLRLTGEDRVRWLQGMVSNDVLPLQTGKDVVHACVLDATGHLLADVTVVNAEDSLILDLDGMNTEKIARLFDSYVITEDVEIADVSDSLICFSLQGSAVSKAWIQSIIADTAIVVASRRSVEGGFDLFMPAEEAPTLWERLTGSGARPVGEHATEIHRVEAGIPRYGLDMDETTIPLEANLEATHISYQKGCYVGQEIIARIQSRGHTNRALTGFTMEGDLLPEPKSAVMLAEETAQKPVGWVTSSVFSPSLQSVIALGYIRHEHRSAGVQLIIDCGSKRLNAKLASLPFRNALQRPN